MTTLLEKLRCAAIVAARIADNNGARVSIHLGVDEHGVEIKLTMNAANGKVYGVKKIVSWELINDHDTALEKEIEFVYVGASSEVLRYNESLRRKL